MSKQQATQLLKQKAQRITEKRVALLAFIMKRPRAYALSDLEKELNLPIDRVTIYRTLHTYEEIGLVLRMVNHHGVGMYMFNHEAHRDTYAHFHLSCRACHQVVCLPSLPHDYLHTLEACRIENMNFLMEGVCSACLTAGE